MASLSFLATTKASPLHRPLNSHFPSPPPSTSTRRRFYTSCDSSSSKNTANTTNTSDNGTTREESQSGSSLLRLDRRNVLLGLGGLYGATNLTSRGNQAIGAPIAPPDLSKCHIADGTSAGEVQCCPPYSGDTIVDYTFPSSSKPLRVRRPAHLLEREEIEKYKEALAKMRELTKKDPDDPRGWMQQANVHCQFCNGAFDQVGYDGVQLQVHYSWLFLPWHRWYLHFYERILGSLIGDDSFALPFWNWDTPDGMYTPSIFVDPSSSLYDENRNLTHYPPAILDFNYSFGKTVPSSGDEVQDVIDQNLLTISKTYKETLALPSLFLGDPITAGEVSDTNGTGGLETIHNSVHMWTGPDSPPYMDMGNFYSAGRDPIFFCHHSNVDRMWHIYRSMRGNKTEFNDKNWLDASFVFVDENKQMVKVKLSDSLNPQKLKYTYEEVELPWAVTGIRKKLVKAEPKTRTRATVSLVPISEFGSEPKILDRSTIRVLVNRPKLSRSKSDKESAIEVLVISGIKAPRGEPSRFDIYVTTPITGELASPSLGELAGSFVKLPHQGSKNSGATPAKAASLKLGINNLLEDLEVEGAEKLVVSLVPRLGKVTVGGVSIDLLDTE